MSWITDKLDPYLGIQSSLSSPKPRTRSQKIVDTFISLVGGVCDFVATMWLPAIVVFATVFGLLWAGYSAAL